MRRRCAWMTFAHKFRNSTDNTCIYKVSFLLFNYYILENNTWVRGNTRFISNMNMISQEWAQRTSEISCSTFEINLVFPSIHVFFCLLYKGQCLKSNNILQKSDNWKAIIFTCEIIINNLTYMCRDYKFYMQCSKSGFIEHYILYNNII
jgi:hypothetical protein